MTAVPHSAFAKSLAIAVMAMPQTTWAGAFGQDAGLAVSPWRVIGSLLLCLGLGAAAIVLLRRRYGLSQMGSLNGPAQRRIRVVEQQGLGAQCSLSLIEIDRRAYVALIAPGAAALVALDRPCTASGSGTPSGSDAPSGSDTPSGSDGA